MHVLSSVKPVSRALHAAAYKHYQNSVVFVAAPSGNERVCAPSMSVVAPDLIDTLGRDRSYVVERGIQHSPSRLERLSLLCWYIAGGEERGMNLTPRRTSVVVT